MSGANASIKALRALLSAGIIPHRDMGKHFRELAGRNDRLVAVVCGANIEATLKQLLRQAMPNGPGKLFEPNQPLSSFSAKINLAYSLNLIDSDVRRNADYIREIRNVFAHRIAPTSFRTPEVVAVCKLLSLGKWEGHNRALRNMRTRYLMATVETGVAISKRGLSPTGPPASLPEKRPVLHPRPRPSRHPR